jgi:uncharacterized protein (TIGR03435 family)
MKYIASSLLPHARSVGRALFIAVSFMALHHAVVARAQSTDKPAIDARPAFEVASIKANKSGAKAAINITPGRFTCTSLPLRYIIKNAYRILQDVNLQGGPEWVNSESFDIVANTDQAATKDQMWVMLQSLLAERFKLVLRHETRQMPVYMLVAAKSGPKLREPRNMPPPSPEMQRIGALGEMRGLAMALAGRLGRPVIDNTGIAGRYYLMIDVPLAEIPKQTTDIPGSYAPPVDGGGYLFGALEEQLGLKLESKKSPVEILVIDHVEKPSEN